MRRAGSDLQPPGRNGVGDREERRETEGEGRHVPGPRAERQQRFVRALQKKIAQPSNFTKLPDLGRRFMSGVDTDLTTSQLLELAWVKWRSDDKKSKHWVLAGEPAYIGGTAYVLPPSDEKKARIIGKFLGE